MKLTHILAVISLGSLLIACDSLDNPLRNLGHDERVYNSNTGHYEWPDDLASQQKQKRETAALASRPKVTPAPAKSDPRQSDAEKEKLAQAKSVPSTPRKVESTPPPALAPPPAELDPAAPAPSAAPLFPQ